MKESKSYLPRKLLALALSLALAVTWMIPSSMAVYAAEGDEPASGEPAEFAYDSGSGTAEDPGVISKADTLKAFASEVDAGNHVSDNVKLGADIDLSEIENWNPIGAEGKASTNKTKLFAGTFDGNGKTISGMVIKDTYEEEANVGLFSTLGANAQVFGIVMTGVDIDVVETGSYANVRAGGIAGDTARATVPDKAATVDNCSVAGKISAKSVDGMGFAGGILGRAFTGAAITNCVSYADATAVTEGSWNSAYAGSLAGMTGNSTLLVNCAAFGDARATNNTSDGDAYAGGLAGMLSSKTYNVCSLGNASISQIDGAQKNYSGTVAGQVAGSASGDYVYYADVDGAAAYGENIGAIGEDSFVKVAAADMTSEAFVETMNGNLKNTYKALGGSVALKQWAAADGKAVPAGETYAYVEEMATTTIGGLTYFYADTEGALENAVYQAVVKGRMGSTTYEFSKADLTQVGDTSYYYAVPTGTTPLSGTLYGYGDGKAATYKSVYADLGVEADDSYDAITSATAFTGHHAKDIPSMVTYGVNDAGEKYINGLVLDRAAVTVEAKDYVEASILNAAGETLTSEQEALIGTTLKVNPMNAPSAESVPVAVKSAEWTSSKYGIGEFDIVPDDSVDGYVWSEYWGSVYAATVSNGTDTVGAVHWIDLYGEAATSGPHYNKVQLALNNGESVASNKATVNRYAKFFDSNNNLKPGKYTIKIYAEGYETLTAEVTKELTKDEATQAADSAKTEAAGITKEAGYPAANVKAVADAVEALNKVLEKEDATAEEINEAVTALNSAISDAKTAKAEADKKPAAVEKKAAKITKVTPLKKTFKVKALKKKAKKFQLKATVSSGAKATFKKVSGNKKIKVSKTGKVTVKKKLKKGTYKIKVMVAAPATADAKAVTKTVKLVIKVKK